MEVKTKVFYSELPSRNVYVDSVVNELPGYYPARSEFSVEYNDEMEQDLTDVCALYNELVSHRGEEESEEEDPLQKLLSRVKIEPYDGNAFPESGLEIKEEPDCDAEVKESKKPVRRTRRKRHGDKCEMDDSGTKKRKLDVEIETMESCEEKVKPEPDDVPTESDKSEEVLKELCVACIEIYNRRLQERNDRKEFVRNHGFLDQKKVYSWYNIHNLELGDGLFSTLLKKFIRLFDTAYEFDKFIQQLKLERELRMKLCLLDDLRRNGVRHKKMMPLYTKMNTERNAVHAEIRNLDISDILTLSEQLPDAVHFPEKKISKTLEIGHLENFKLLNEEEKELCSIHRLTPVSYLSFKQILMDECRKLGGLKLAQARTMLKIDVNKTRKVYNYLIDKGLIWKQNCD